MNKDSTCYEREWMGPNGEILNTDLMNIHIRELARAYRAEIEKMDKETDKLPK